MDYSYYFSRSKNGYLRGGENQSSKNFWLVLFPEMLEPWLFHINLEILTKEFNSRCLLCSCLWKRPELYEYGNRMRKLLSFLQEQINVNLVSLAIWGYSPLNTCILHLVNLTFIILTSLHSIQVNFSFPVLNVSATQYLSLHNFQVFLESEPYSVSTNHPFPKCMSFFPSFQKEQLLLWGLGYHWFHHHHLLLSLSLSLSIQHLLCIWISFEIF